MLVTFLVEFVLIPYTIFVGGKDLLGNGNWIYENLIDLMHTLNMIVILITQTKGDSKVSNTRFSVIALNYVKSPLFWIDILGSWPTLFTSYQLYWLYYFKILRLADYERASVIIQDFGEAILAGRASKKDRKNFEYLIQLLLAMLVVMHSTACCWIMVGESVKDSWISHLENGIGSESAP